MLVSPHQPRNGSTPRWLRRMPGTVLASTLVLTLGACPQQDGTILTQIGFMPAVSITNTVDGAEIPAGVSMLLEGQVQDYSRPDDVVFYEVIWSVSTAGMSGERNPCPEASLGQDGFTHCTIEFEPGENTIRLQALSPDKESAEALVTVWADTEETPPLVLCRGGALDIPVEGKPVTSCDELEAMGLDPAETYCLTEDIDCSTKESFATIESFSGALYGQGFAIFEPRKTAGSELAGLLFQTMNGQLIDLHVVDAQMTGVQGGVLAYRVGEDGVIEGARVSGNVDAGEAEWSVEKSHIGGLVGLNEGTIVDSFCDVEIVNIHQSDVNIGGVVGFNSAYALISGVQSQGDVYSVPPEPGSSTLGGLVGVNLNKIENSSASGNVEGDVLAQGGLVGACWGSTVAEVRDVWATGQVSGGNSYVGGLIGASGCTVERGLAMGDVSAEGDFVGGLLGSASYPVLESAATGAVSGRTHTGGLIGLLHEGIPVEASYAIGDVEGGWHVGGLVGTLQGEVMDSYALGDVTAIGSSVGGGVGAVTENGVVNRMFATGESVGSGSVGGLIGTNAGIVTGGYWDTTTSESSTSAAGEGRSTLEMLSQETYADWSFDGAGPWTIDEGYSYPCLRWVGVECATPTD